jgi:phage terminase Nu1 subunit (DNA packaging protein)
MPYASLEQLAAVLNMTPQMVNRHVKLHGMPRISRGEYDLIKCVHWYIDYKDQQIKEARRGTETEAQARQRLVVATANLREVDLAQACGELIEIEVAQSLWQRLMVAFKNKMLLIPTKIAPVVVQCKEPNEVQELLEAEIHEALYELSTSTIDTSRIRRFEGFGKIGRRSGSASSKTHRKPVGGSGKNTESGKLRRAGKVEDIKGGISEGNDGRDLRSEGGDSNTDDSSKDRQDGNH